jgi:hypothetical protein
VYNAIAAIIETDSSLNAQDREKILAVCRHPTEFPKSEERRIPQLLGITAAAKTLCISRSTLWRMTRDGQIRVIRLRVDGSPRYNLDDIHALIDGEQHRPRSRVK